MSPTLFIFSVVNHLCRYFLKSILQEKNLWFIFHINLMQKVVGCSDGADWEWQKWKGINNFYVSQQQSDIINSKTKPHDFIIDLLLKLLQESSIFKGNDITIYQDNCRILIQVTKIHIVGTSVVLTVNLWGAHS